MRKIKLFTATMIVATLGCVSQAAATVIGTNWFSNATSNVNIIDPPFPGQPPERLRLQNGSTSGSIEGTVLLPFSDTWTINTAFFADESPGDPTEFIKIIINSVEVGQFFNTPLLAVFPFSTTIVGNQFNYRFEFESNTPTEGLHMIVGVGTASVPMPEPATLALFGLGLAGLGFARRRKAA